MNDSRKYHYTLVASSESQPPSPVPSSFYQYHYPPPPPPSSSPPSAVPTRSSVFSEASHLSFDIFPDQQNSKHDASTTKLGTRSERSKLLKYHGEKKKKRPPTNIRFIYLVSIAEVLLFGISVYKNGGFESLKVNPMIGPSAKVLLELGANYDYYIIYEGEWWRFITAIFLHAGLIHLGFNLMFQIQQGVPLEREFGSLRIAIIYVLGGITGNLMSSIFLPTVLSVGASGSLFALLGTMLAALVKNWRILSRPCTSTLFILLAISINLFIGMLPHIDNFAHVGGLLAGILFGMALIPTAKSSYVLTFVSLLSFFAGVIGLITGFYIFYHYQHEVHDWCTWCRYIDCIPVLGWCDSFE